jgi:small-conductance mechanosensitive channel
VAAVLFGVIAGITVLNQFDVEIGPVLASLGVAGLAAALALQDTLGNFFAGLIIAVDRPVRVGDYVRLEDGLEGHVISIGWRTTRIRPFGETMVIVPNSKLANSILTNSDYPSSTTRVYVPCGVSYESDLRQVERVAIEVAREAQESEIIADSSFQPFVIFDAFGDSNITFRTVLRVLNSANSGTLRSAFMKRLHERFAAEGIAMNYPVRKLMVDPQHPLHVAGVAVPATPPQPSA